MLAIWSLVPLPFRKPAWTSRSSQFTYCWSLTWRILSISFLACEMNAIIREMHIKTTIKYHLTSVRMAITKKTRNNKCWQEHGEKGALMFCWYVSVCVCSLLSRIQLFATPQTVTRKVPLFMEFQARKLEWVVIPFSRGSCWPRNQTWVSCTAGRFFTNCLPFPSPGDLPGTGIKPKSLAFPALACRFFYQCASSRICTIFAAR